MGSFNIFNVLQVQPQGLASASGVPSIGTPGSLPFFGSLNQGGQSFGLPTLFPSFSAAPSLTPVASQRFGTNGLGSTGISGPSGGTGPGAAPQTGNTGTTTQGAGCCNPATSGTAPAGCPACQPQAPAGTSPLAASMAAPGAFPGGAEILSLVTSLNAMLSVVTQLIGTLLQQIMSGAISGKAPEGGNNNSSLGSALGSNKTGANKAGSGNANASSGASGPASSQKPNDQGFIAPIKSMHKPSETGDFGSRVPPTAGASSFHNGNDLGGSMGEDIFAVKDGTIKVLPNNGGAGNTIEIDHGNGLVTKYFHMSKFADFKTGDKVKQGQVIGQVGTTGTSTGPHLHFEVHQNGKAVDPWPFLMGLV